MCYQLRLSGWPIKQAVSELAFDWNPFLIISKYVRLYVVRALFGGSQRCLIWSKRKTGDGNYVIRARC